MKNNEDRKPGWKQTLIMAFTFIIFLLLFHYWDKIKALVAAIFN